MITIANIYKQISFKYIENNIMKLVIVTTRVICKSYCFPGQVDDTRRG